MRYTQRFNFGFEPRIMEQFEIRTDMQRNRIYCLLGGFFLESEVDLAFDNIRDEVKKLNSGYDVIVDIQNLYTRPGNLKDIFFCRLKNLVIYECRYLFKITGNNKLLERIKKISISKHNYMNKIKFPANIKAVEAYIEKDLYLDVC